jgi:4-hydroxybenzoate polyprenyltransferase
MARSILSVQRPLRMRTLALKAEALFWMSRLWENSQPVWLVLMGWLAADPRGDARLAWLLVFIVAAASAMLLLNDIRDEQDDRTTAPFLPLPAGLVSRRAAVTLTGALLVVAAVALAAAAQDAARFIACVGLLALSTLTISVYSSVKHAGIAGSLLGVGAPFAMIPLLAWIVGHGEGAWPIAAVVAYGLVSGMSTNTLAALRDVDLDGSVGNRTLAVRLGGPRAFRVAVALALVATGFAATVAIEAADAWAAVALVAVSLAITLAAYAPALARFREPQRGRVQRIADMRWIKLGEFTRHASVVAVFSVGTAASVGIGLQVLLILGSLAYDRRIVGGDIARQLRPG